MFKNLRKRYKSKFAHFLLFSCSRTHELCDNGHNLFPNCLFQIDGAGHHSGVSAPERVPGSRREGRRRARPAPSPQGILLAQPHA